MGSHSKWDWKRLHKIAYTYLNEWMRQVEFNDALLSEISITRQRFDFPLNDLDAAIQWSSDNPSGYADLSKIMNSLAEKFQINDICVDKKAISYLEYASFELNIFGATLVR